MRQIARSSRAKGSLPVKSRRDFLSACVESPVVSYPLLFGAFPGGIAQRSEQAAHNCLVHGSNPCAPTLFYFFVRPLKEAGSSAARMSTGALSCRSWYSRAILRTKGEAWAMYLRASNSSRSCAPSFFVR